MEPQNIPKPEKRQRVKTTTKRKKPLEQEVLLRKGCWGPSGPPGSGAKLPDGPLGGPLKPENVGSNGGLEEWKGEGWQQRNGHVDLPSNGPTILHPPSSAPAGPDPENPMSLPPHNSQLGHDSSNNDNNNGSNNNSNDLMSHGGGIKTPASLPPTPSSQHSQNQQNPQQNAQMNCRPLSNMGPNGLILGRGRPQSTGMPEGLNSGTGSGGGPGGHFMSQQSQIFVFSTGLANEAAESVQRGQSRSIVDFHLETPATRQFLQNFPLGANSFNRPQSMPPFLDNNNMAKFPSKEHQPPPMPFNETGSALANVELWVQQQNASLQEGPFSPSFGPSGNSKQSRNRNNSSGQRWLPSPSSRMSNNPQMDFGPDHPMHIPPGYMGDPQMPPNRGMMPANLDENLTPEQLQRREEQLAQLQKIKNMLFPEKRNEFGGRPHPGMYGPPRPGPDGMMGMIRFPPGHPSNMMGPGGIGLMEPPHDQMMGLEMDPSFFNGNGPLPPGLPPNWENMSNEEREWFKLQHEYYMERQKHQMQMSRSNGGPPPPPGYFGEMGPQSRMPGPHSPVSPSFAMNRDPSGFFFQGPPPPGMNFPQNGPGPHPPDFHPDFMQGGMPEGMFFGPNGPVGPRMHHAHDPMTPMGPFGPGGARFPTMCKPKRRRNNGAEKSEDIYRHLQPAPPPEQFCSLNLIEGQEVTITRQLNLAYQDPSDDRSPSQQNFNNLNNSQQQPKKKKKSDNNVQENNDSHKSNNSHDNNNQRNFDFENDKMKKSIPHQQHNMSKTSGMEKQDMSDVQSPSANFSNNKNNNNNNSNNNVLPLGSGPPNSKTKNVLSNMVSPATLSKELSDRNDSEGMQAGMYRTVQMSDNDNPVEGMLSGNNNQQGMKNQPPHPSDKTELMANNPQDNKNFDNDKMVSLKSLAHQHNVEKQELQNECSPSQNFNNNNNNNKLNNNNGNNTNSMNNNNMSMGSAGMPPSRANGGVMNNITSPTLASLAKGVESLSGRIEQDMLQGGLFRTVQMPENENELSEDAMVGANNQGANKMRSNDDNGNNNNNNSGGGGVNNNNGNNNNNGGNNNGNNNNNENSNNDNNNNGNNNNNNINGDNNKGQNNGQESNMNNRGSFEFFGGEKMGGMPLMHHHDKRSPHMFPPEMKGPPQNMVSPRMHGMIGNANVQIEASAPNTIQYMPARPPNEQGSDNNGPHPMPPPGYNGPDYGPLMGLEGNPMFDTNFMVPPNFDGGPMGGPNDINGPVGPGYGNLMPRGFNGPNIPGFNNGQNGPIGFDSQGGPIFESSLPPGMGGPMIPGYNGPPPPGFSGQPPFPNGHQGHIHPAMMPGFDGHCGPMGEFDGPMPGMPPYGSFGPRGQCGPMMGGGFHPGGPMGMSHPELFGHRMPMMPVEGKINENPRGKEGGTKKEKERKKRSESKKAANSNRNMQDKSMPGPGGMGNNMRPGSALMMSMGGPEMGMRPGGEMMMGHPSEMMIQGPDGIMLREGGMSRGGMGRMMMPDMEGMICRNGPMNPMMDMPNGGDMFHGPMMMEGDQFNNRHPPPPFDMMRPESNFNGGGIISGDPGLGR